MAFAFMASRQTSDTELVDELIVERRSGAMPDDMPSWMASVINKADAFSNITGRVVCWIVVPIFLAMAAEIFLRKFFNAPTLWAYDVSRMLYGALFMLGAGYTLMRGAHIRADFLYRLWSVKIQALVDFCLYLVFYFPGLLFFLWTSSEYTFEAIQRAERLDDTAWRPLVWPARLTMPIGALFLLIQGISEVLKSYYALTRGRWP